MDKIKHITELSNVIVIKSVTIGDIAVIFLLVLILITLLLIASYIKSLHEALSANKDRQGSRGNSSLE